MQVSQSRKDKIFEDSYYKHQLSKSQDFEESIERLVADIWDKVIQKHIPEMLVNLESLEYVPRKIRMKMADEPLFISRYE